MPANRSRSVLSPLSSLRGRLLFLICLATLPALLFTFVLARNERAAALARTEDDAFHLARLASREHQHQIEGARELLEWLGAALGREGASSPVVADPEFLPALLAGHPQLANIGVLDPSGQVLSSAVPLESFPSLADNPAFVAALASREVVSGTYLVSPIFHRPTLNHAYAVRGDDGGVRWVLFNGLDLEWLSELAAQVELSESFSMLISDRDGRVLTHVGDFGKELASDASLRIAGIADLARSPHGSLLPIGTTGIERYFVAAPLGGSPDLFVAVGIPYGKLIRESNAVFYRSLAALGLLTLFTITAVWVAAELAVLRALRALVQTVRRFGAGDLGARAGAPAGYDELASLAKAFNTMADSLAERHRESVESQERLRALSSRLQMAREAEAARISRELHDEIGQLLTSLKLDLARLKADGSGNAPGAPALAREVESMNGRIASAIDFVRRISSELRPSVLDKLGLASALEWQAREIETRTGLTVHVDAEELEPGPPEPVAVTLFRIAQEALTNVVRHAGAGAVEVMLARRGDAILLEISDDGAGIPDDAVDSRDSLGIVGMRERAMLIGARLTITSHSAAGTTVSVSVPAETTEVPHAGTDPSR